MAADHDALTGSCNAVLILVADRLPRATVEQVAEFVDASEFGVAVEWLADALADLDVAVPAEAFALLDDLFTTMLLPRDRLDRLRPLVGPD